MLDYILLAIVILTLIYLIIRITYRFLFIAFGISFLWILFGTFSNGYGFKELINDYTDFTYVVNRSARPQEIIISKLTYFPNKVAFSKALDFESPEVRSFCISAIRKHFKGVMYPSKVKPLVHSLAIFKEINNQWLYVYDPAFREYYASPMESIKTLAGDCDDHSILMASCIKLVGATPRMVYTTGHVYPEIYIGKKKDLDILVQLIKKELFKKETKNKAIHYHIDENNNIWLNLDYTGHYPGGKFINEEILGTYTLF